MNVGVFLSRFFPEAGGGHTFESDIFQSLLEVAGESHHHFTVFYPHRQSEKIKRALKSPQLRGISYPQPTLIERALSRISLQLPYLVRIFERPSYVESVARKMGIEFVWFVGPQPVQLDLPYLTIVWDLQHRIQPWFPEVSADGIWDEREVTFSRFLRRASIIITGTEAGRKEIERFYQLPPERIKILPHPTPRFALQAFLHDAKPVLGRYNIPDNYLFYPAQFWSHKNHANLLWAVRKLRDEYGLAFPVVFVGSDQGNKGYIQRLVDQLGLSDGVHFLGFVSQEDLVSLYRNAFALTYLTFFGPENLPPLEAFALGCPVIASNVEGAQEQLGDAALLVDPRNPEEIALAIKTFHNDGELRKILVQRGRERASKWTGKDFVRGVFAILDDFESIRRCWDR